MEGSFFSARSDDINSKTPSLTLDASQFPPQIAKRQGVVNPENTFFSVKRFIGRRWDEVGEKDREVPYTCLLYTSPSPRDKRQSRMPSSA